MPSALWLGALLLGAGRPAAATVGFGHDLKSLGVSATELAGAGLSHRPKPGTVGGTALSEQREEHAVLTLTENANTVVKSIVDQSGTGEQAGLRISQDEPDSPALHVMPTQAPQPGDQVLEEAGARVFLEENAAATLDDKVLDAQVDANGGVQFTIASQTG